MLVVNIALLTAVLATPLGAQTITISEFDDEALPTSIFADDSSITSTADSAASTLVSGSLLPLGAKCTNSDQCADNASCYAVNAMLNKICGNIQAACDRDSQCAFNTCVSGSCSGKKVLPLGAQCDAKADTPCANGAQCYATNSMLIAFCGNFQAGCTMDSQCAFNTCESGFCNGKESDSISTNSGSNTVTSLLIASSNGTIISSSRNAEPTSSGDGVGGGAGGGGSGPKTANGDAVSRTTNRRADGIGSETATAKTSKITETSTPTKVPNVAGLLGANVGESAALGFVIVAWALFG